MNAGVIGAPSCSGVNAAAAMYAPRGSAEQHAARSVSVHDAPRLRTRTYTGASQLRGRPSRPLRERNRQAVAGGDPLRTWAIATRTAPAQGVSSAHPPSWSRRPDARVDALRNPVVADGSGAQRGRVSSEAGAGAGAPMGATSATGAGSDGAADGGHGGATTEKVTVAAGSLGSLELPARSTAVTLTRWLPTAGAPRTSGGLQAAGGAPSMLHA
jgi:hypothetical protein